MLPSTVALISVVFHYAIVSLIVPKINSSNFALTVLDKYLSNFFYSILFVSSTFIIDNLGLIIGFISLAMLDRILVFLDRRKKFKWFPLIDIPNSDSVNVLLMLFEIRCLEISMVYAIIREKQSKVKEGDWIELFLNEHFVLYNLSDDLYSDDSEKYSLREQQNKKAVANLLKSEYDFQWADSYLGYPKNKCYDLLIGLILEENIYDIEKLRDIRCYGVAENTISALISEYKKFRSRPSAIFIQNTAHFRFLKSKTIRSLDNIDEIWKEIIFALRSSLIFLKTKNDTTQFNVDLILQEIDALNDLQSRRALHALIERKNISEVKSLRSFVRGASEKNEKLIVSKLKNNPNN